MGAAPPSPHVTLRAMSGTFLIIRVIDAPPALSRFAFAHRNFSPGQMMFTARLREALHEPASLSAIRRFYTDQRLIVDNKSDLQIMQDFVHDLEIGRLAVFYFSDLHGTGRPLSGPPAEEAIAPATGAVSGWSMRQRLAEMFRRLPRFVPDAVRGEIVAFLSEENIRNMVAFFIVFALVQTIPGADAAADAVLTALAWYYYGWGGAVAAYKLIAAVVTAATAKSEADIDHAARDAAQALVALGTVFLLKKLNDRMRQRGGQEEGGGGADSANRPLERIDAARPVAKGWIDYPSTVKVAAKNATSPANIDEYVSTLKSWPTPTSTNAGLFEVEQAGPLNYRVLGGGTAIDIDGYENSTILEAKFVGNPASSPYVPSSDIPTFLRDKILAQQQYEFERFKAIISDPTCPFESLSVLTNEPAAVPYFQNLMNSFNIPGVVKTVPTIIP